MNIRYDFTVHASDDGRMPVCGTGEMPAMTPEPTTEPVTCWECEAITS